MKCYVLMRPDGVGEIFDTWEACRDRLTLFPGAPHQAVDSREKAQAMINGGIVLPAGTYVFTDGNALGGVGIALLESDGIEPRLTADRATHVFEVFQDGTVPGLESRSAVSAALDGIHNILSELAGLYGGLDLLPRHATATVVHDYAGVGAWITGSYKKTRHPITKSVVAACRARIADLGLELNFIHQRGHQKGWVARDDFAKWNDHVDKLANTGAAALANPRTT